MSRVQVIQLSTYIVFNSHPHHFSATNLYHLIRWTPRQFTEYCQKSREATSSDSSLSHESRVFCWRFKWEHVDINIHVNKNTFQWHFYRLVHSCSYYVLQALLDCNYETARACFQDMVFFELMKVDNQWTFMFKSLFIQNPMGTCPTVWNDVLASDAEKSQLLWDIRRRQGPGITRMLDAFRTPLGRPVS